MVDFKTDASEEHFTVGTHGAIQRGEVVTIDGSIYERFGRPHGAASKEWVRTGSTESLSPFDAGSGGLLDLSGLPVDLKRIGRVDLHGIQTVEYQVSSITATCPPGASGDLRSEVLMAWAWVGPDGRIQQFKRTGTAHFGGSQAVSATFRFDSVSILGSFGVPVNISAPSKFTVASTSLTKGLQLQPGPACRVTNG